MIRVDELITIDPITLYLYLYFWNIKIPYFMCADIIHLV